MNSENHLPALQEIHKVWEGGDAVTISTPTEAYLLTLVKKMSDIASESIKTIIKGRLEGEI